MGLLFFSFAFFVLFFLFLFQFSISLFIYCGKTIRYVTLSKEVLSVFRSSSDCENIFVRSHTKIIVIFEIVIPFSLFFLRLGQCCSVIWYYRYFHSLFSNNQINFLGNPNTPAFHTKVSKIFSWLFHLHVSVEISYWSNYCIQADLFSCILPIS